MAPNLLLLLLLTIVLPLSLQQDLPPLNPKEQESLYLALESINSAVPWRTLFPDDLCYSPPHGVVCDYFYLDDGLFTPHVTELNFGPVSDFSPNPSCSPNATFPLSLSSFPHLKRLFFYRCFTHNPVLFPDFAPAFGSHLHELVFIENPTLIGPLTRSLPHFTALRRLILTGTAVSGPIPADISRLVSLEQLTLSRNHLGGAIPNLGGTALRILDLSENGLDGPIPDSVGRLRNLLKLDLSSNALTGKIPETLKGLKSLEFLDLSRNKLGSYGVPEFLGEMRGLKEVHLSGNQLGGQIPDIWKNLGGILGIGLSNVGLVGNIPASMGVFLGNAAYIGLDNNSLDGSLPKEFGMLGRVHEINLQNNRLVGRVPLGFASGNLKLQGNPDLCVDKDVLFLFKTTSNANLKTCTATYLSYSAPVNAAATTLYTSSSISLVMSFSLLASALFCFTALHCT